MTKLVRAGGMPLIPNPDGPIAVSDEAYRKLSVLKASVATIREKWYIGVPSVLIPLAEDIATTGPASEIVDSGLFGE